jgi:hypothetical protein
MPNIYPASLRFFTINRKYWLKYVFRVGRFVIIDLSVPLLKKVIEENAPNNIKIYSKFGEEYFDDADAKREFVEKFTDYSIGITKVGLCYSCGMFILGYTTAHTVYDYTKNKTLQDMFNKLIGKNFNSINFDFEMRIKYAVSNDNFIKFYVLDMSIDTESEQGLVYLTVDMNISKYANEIQQIKKQIQDEYINNHTHLIKSYFNLYTDINNNVAREYDINMFLINLDKSESNLEPKYKSADKLIYLYKKWDKNKDVKFSIYTVYGSYNHTFYFLHLIKED